MRRDPRAPDVESAAPLSERHARMIRDSAISAEVAAERGYRTVYKKSELIKLGFGVRQANAPALLVPIRDVRGEIATYQVRPDTPRMVKGRPTKYETPAKTQMVLDVPKRCVTEKWIKDPRRPLFITEGARKADAGVSQGYCVIGVIGVWNFRGTNEFGGKVALADWDEIALDGRDVFIVFDSDVVTKAAVRKALERLRALLQRRKAKVHIVLLPDGPGGAKVGLDDYLAAGHTMRDVMSLTSDVLDVPDSHAERHGPYGVTKDGRTIHRKTTSEGDVVEQSLALFSARIAGEEIEDDGAEQRRAYRIVAMVNGREHEISVRADEFALMNWPAQQLGPKAIVCAGMGSKDKLREAIQRLSDPDLPTRRVFLHLGWSQIDGKDVFVHAAGAIGAEGAVPNIAVNLEAPLNRFALPPVPVGEELRAAISASLRLLRGLVSDNVVFPALALVWGAIVGAIRTCVHLAGGTGVRKTELASLIQRHFGDELRSDALASWSSTGNALEVTAFLAKDHLLAVDDFNPTGSAADVQAFHATADRFLRAVANGSARARLRADGTARPIKPPRCCVLSTGEDVPEGHSLRARMLVVEVKRGDVDLEALTRCQDEAREYSKVTAAFIQSIALHREERRAWFRSEVARIRDELLRHAPHGRTATAGAELITSLRSYFIFALESGAITEAETRALDVRARRAILYVLEQQAAQQSGSNSALLFMQNVAASLRSGEAHLLERGGGRPEPAELARATGWRQVHISSQPTDQGEWKPCGPKIGWIDAESDAVYLDPLPAYRAAQRQGEEGGGRITVGVKTLWKRLADEGLLAAHDAGRNTHKLRLSTDRLANVIYVRLSVLLDESGTTGTDTAPGASLPDMPLQRLPVPADRGDSTAPTVPDVLASVGSGDELLGAECDVPARREFDFGDGAGRVHDA